MTILIAYTTNSGGTYLASNIVQTELEKHNHTATVKKIDETDSSEFNSYDLIILASPSWWVNHKDGQPPESFQDFMKKNADINFSHKKFAILGLGDTSYMHFCGAVDVLESFVKEHHGQLAVESLRIDGFYFNEKNEELVKQWAEKINTLR